MWGFMSSLQDWIQRHNIEEVECLVPDMSGIARGKILPSGKFIKGIEQHGLRLPEGVFTQAVTGDFPYPSTVSNPANLDIFLQPDPDTIRLVPWYPAPTAQVVCDGFYMDGEPVTFASRYVLKRVLGLYEEQGWKPVVAPELEFYLVKMNADADYPLEPPVGLSGRQESGRQAYGIEAANEFDPIVEDIYDFCEAQHIDIDTFAHEAGAAQMEINFNHGDALELADQVFLFKRTVRQAALRHQVYATFMAKPHQHEPGSSMHVHQSVVDMKTGRNIFATKMGKDTPRFLNYIGGLQRYVPSAMPLMAPNVNSFRRLAPHQDAPINVHWGRDNRTVGLRVPVSDGHSRRVENRVAGADANPYLAIAATLACGYIGMTEKLKPQAPIEGSAYRLAFTLPRHQGDALAKLNRARRLKEVLGETFVEAMNEVKNLEYELYQEVISSWERENLLLNV
jgi:glutamine synthetase